MYKDLIKSAIHANLLYRRAWGGVTYNQASISKHLPAHHNVLRHCAGSLNRPPPTAYLESLMYTACDIPDVPYDWYAKPRHWIPTTPNAPKPYTATPAASVLAVWPRSCAGRAAYARVIAVLNSSRAGSADHTSWSWERGVALRGWPWRDSTAPGAWTPAKRLRSRSAAVC